MKPISFLGQTIVLKKPDSMTDEECSSLPIAQIPGGICASCWKMNLRERLTALLTGEIWLGVVSGHTQPPVFLSTDKPFKIVKAKV